jgi:tetratricopeptide (TPR) repeat protein
LQKGLIVTDRHDRAVESLQRILQFFDRGEVEMVKALGHDDNAGVANLIGSSYRKLGAYRQSQIWYERALKTDPNHVLTWQ